MVRDNPGTGGAKSPAGAFTLAALGTVAFLQTWLSGVNRADEVWFFSLAKMHAEGGVPYRDFAFHVLPGSLYLSAMLLRLVGMHIFVLKALVAALVAGTIWLSARAFERLGGAPRWRAPFLLAGLLLSPALPGSAYGPMAYLFLVGTLLATLRGVTSSSVAPWLRAALLAALTFASKYNAGVLALGSTLAARILASRTNRWRDAAVMLAVFLGTVSATLIPLGHAGAWSEFFSEVFAAKTTYLQAAPVLPLAGKRAGLPPSVVFSPQEDALRLLLRAASFSAVGGAILALAALWWRHGQSRQQLTVLAFFLVSGIATAFPRFDSEHVLPCVPVALIPLTLWLEERTTASGLRPVRMVLTTVLSLGLALPLWSWRQGIWQPSGLPYLAGARISAAEAANIEATRAFAATIPPADKVLFLGPYAAFYHLVTGRLPATKYLFPLVTELGAEGQHELRVALEHGDVRWVCLQTWRWPMRPAVLEDFVTGTLRFITTTGECAWFQGPQAPDAHKRGNAGF